MRSRKPTQDNGVTVLTPQQLTAVDLLASGTNITETAAAIGVSRETTSGWVHHFPAFEAALNARRQALWDATADRLRSLLPKALAVLEKELAGDTPLPAAIHVLKSCGLAGLSRPTGPTDPVEIDLAARRLKQSQALRARGLAQHPEGDPLERVLAGLP